MINYNLKPEIFYRLLTGIAASAAGYFAYEKYKGYQVREHPTREMAEMTLKLDKRITNFCGKNYKIINYRMLSDNDDFVTYRMNLEGMRGKCKVLVKCQKHTHVELKSHSNEQIVYSKMTKEQKATNPFVPYNYNDVITPTKETLKKMKDILQAKNLPEDNLIFHRMKYIDGDYHNAKSDVMKALRKPIEHADTFYRITSLVMVANDNLVFNIRPIGPKYRSYDIEDTIYNIKTYEDVIKKLMNFRFTYSDFLMDDFSAEEYRNEIIMQKQTKFIERTQMRKWMSMFNFTCLFVGYFLYKIFLKQGIDASTIKSLQSKIIGLGPKAGLGNTKRLLCIDYKYSLLNGKFNINGLVMGENGAMKGIETFAYVNDVNPHGNVNMYSLKHEPKSEKNKTNVKIQI